MDNFQRQTQRKDLILKVTSGQTKPMLLSELRAIVHREETSPRSFKEFTISDSYAHSFNRTIRGMFPIVKTYKIQPTIDTLFAGIAARVLILQCLKKGLYRKVPQSGQIPKVIIFGELRLASRPIGPRVGMRWLSGVVLSSKGTVRHVSSSLASYQPTFVHTSPPTWGDLLEASKCPWGIGVMTAQGCIGIPSTALLMPIGIFRDETIRAVTIDGRIHLDRGRTRPPREIVLPKLRDVVQNSFNGKITYRAVHVGYQEHVVKLGDAVDLAEE